MRLIDADALCEGRVNNDNVVICAQCAPTVDAVKVVRCKDCKYYRESKPFSVLITECTYSDCSIWTEPNGYCHRAKKRRVE